MSALEALSPYHTLLLESPVKPSHLIHRQRPRSSTHAMVATSMTPQRLSARDPSAHGGNDHWGTMQIATPAIVGGVLLLLFAVYIMWRRRRPNEKGSYNYQQVRSDWVTKIERMFVPRRQRQQALRASEPMTLDDSMRTSGLTLDLTRLSRQYRAASFDVQTPLTSTYHGFDYPPSKPPRSPPPRHKHRPMRWWWLFGSRPQEVKSQEPSQRWRIDGPDGSSTEHGHNNYGHVTRGVLVPLREDPEEDQVIWIGGNLASIASTPMTQHLPDQTNFARGPPIVPEHLPSGARTLTPAVSVQPSNPGTPIVPSANRGLPPSYDVSQSQARYASTEDVVRPAHFGSYTAIPPPVRAAGYSSPRVFHGRELSSDSFLVAQSPMVAPSTY